MFALSSESTYFYSAPFAPTTALFAHASAPLALISVRQLPASALLALISVRQLPASALLALPSAPLALPSAPFALISFRQFHASFFLLATLVLYFGGFDLIESSRSSQAALVTYSQAAPQYASLVQLFFSKLNYKYI